MIRRIRSPTLIPSSFALALRKASCGSVRESWYLVIAIDVVWHTYRGYARGKRGRGFAAAYFLKGASRCWEQRELDNNASLLPSEPVRFFLHHSCLFPCAIQNITDRLLMSLSMASAMMGCGGCKSGFPPLDRILMLLHSATVSSARHKKFARLSNDIAAPALPSSNCKMAIP